VLHEMGDTPLSRSATTNTAKLCFEHSSDGWKRLNAPKLSLYQATVFGDTFLRYWRDLMNSSNRCTVGHFAFA
jgi:hypothetical protein